MTGNELIPHLFRTEYSRITAVLSKYFGIEHLDMAEDIASETFLMAVDTWPYKGVPPNPQAWLYAVAKNKAKNHLARNKIFRKKISGKIKHTDWYAEDADIDLSGKNITDSQLEMLFTVCHPSVSEEAQVCLALRVLCGFGIDEIAGAFFTNKETIHKRLQRAKEKLRSENIQMAMPLQEQMKARLDTVLRTIYLLFSEGYYSESHPSLIRKELCIEAINLTSLLLDNEATNTHAANALMSLMCFHSSRLDARFTDNNDMIVYDEQDENRWDTELIEKGFYYLQQASKWEVTSKYYLEASIAYWHTVKTDAREKWESILRLYDLLIQIENSPAAMLNRVYALSKVKGNEAAVAEAEKMNMPGNHFYYILLAELYKNSGREKVKECFTKALSVCKNETEKQFILKKMNML